jgi:hypothetical protein
LRQGKEVNVSEFNERVKEITECAWKVQNDAILNVNELINNFSFICLYNSVMLYACMYVCRDMGHRSSCERTQKMEGINSRMRYQGKKVA